VGRGAGGQIEPGELADPEGSLLQQHLAGVLDERGRQG
jgi:hypothetical protein